MTETSPPAPARKKRRSDVAAGDARRPREVTRYIPVPVQLLLWGRSAGRCEFAGCNKPLWKSSVTQEQLNIAQKAHIYAFSADGPRGHAALPPEKINDLSNLMLGCHECHEAMDKEPDGGRYTVPLLQAMKAQHERRIEIVTGIAPDRHSHVVLYGANIGAHSSPLNFPDTARALFPDRYPADDRPIELGMVNSSFQERDPAFWTVEAANLRAKVDQRIRERMAGGGISHLSVFALAPQPLLILLGSMLTDIPKADVFQLHREPAGWNWPASSTPPCFEIREPDQGAGPPALVLALSATVTDDRVTSVLGGDARIWTVTIPGPNNDFLKSRDHLAAFRALLRPLLDRIKSRHGQNATLHIFPAAPVSATLELGRVRMPKADMPWRIYDQVNALGGFVPALSIPSGD